MLQAAQQAKDNLHSVHRVAREALGMSQAFHAGAVLGGTPPTAGVYLSQAEKKLTRYLSDGSSAAASSSGSRGNQGAQHLWMCFGCGGPHAYLEYRGNQGHVVICPNHDNPGVRENATKNIEKMWKNKRSIMSRTSRGRILGWQTYPTLTKKASTASPSRSSRP